MIWRFFNIIVLILLIPNVGFTQNEANIWYFGENAGLDFNSGTPIPLLDGQLNTTEGCATISDTNGDLLFYTDGITVWNKNHSVMFNGTGLNGDASSTHSAIIVPKPNDLNIYYIFTVDDVAGPNGLQYSEVDMTLDSGLGGITANKNILLFTPITEKLTAIKSSTANEYWVVSHKWNSDEFLSYNISSTGINTTPIVSAIGSIITGDDGNAIGQLKISPDGSKLAMATAGTVNTAELFDFNASTGIVTNGLLILDLPIDESVYGIEFSPNSKVLYVSAIGNAVFQYNLQAGSSLDIINSQLQLTTLPRPYAALQLATDGKIYVAKTNQFYIDVINNPNVVGAGCGYLFESLYLDGKRSKSGLPPFIQTFLLIDDIQFENVCFGDTTNFSLTDTVDIATWDFDDPASGANNISTDLAPNHIFSAPGTYEVSVNVTIGTQSASSTTTVTIYEQPTATQPQDILICDDNNDGFYSFDLTQNESTILNGQSTSVFDITYYASITDYTNDNHITNPSSYTNTTAYNSQTIVASLRNSNNSDCEDTTIFNIEVFESPTPSTIIPSLTFCDNTSVGTDTDSIIEFDLTQNETAILNGQSPTEYTVNYYTDAGLTNTITNPTSYQNTNPTETIYVEVVSNNNLNCVAQTNFTIEVFDLPTISSTVLLSQCDDSLDGFSAFNLNEVINEITTNATTETITFYPSQTDAINQTNQIVNPETYINQTASTDTVWAYVENISGCFRVSEVQLNVSTTQIPSTFIRDIYKCDDNTDGDAYNGYTTFNFSNIDNEIQALFPVGQQLTISYYQTLADALSETNQIADISNYTNSIPTIQDIYIRVDSTVNNDCLGLGMHLTLHVEDIPLEVNPITLTQCDEFNDGMESFDTSTINTQLVQGQANIDVTFRDEDGITLPSPLPNPFTTTQQTINVVLTNNLSQDPSGACEITSTIDFVIDGGVIANSVSDFSVCDDNNDGFYDFDTSTIEQTVLNGQSDVIVFYYDEQGNTLPSPLPNPFTTSTQTITVRVENATSAICYDETEINFIVNQQPIANTVTNDFICDDILNDGEAIFDLSSYVNQVLNGQSATLFNISYHLSQTEADLNTNPLPNNYTCSTTSETIFVRIENVNNTSCYDTKSFQIGVNYLPIANQPEDISICDDETNDGIEVFDLNSQNSMILNGQLASEHNITFHLSQDEAELGENAIVTNFENTTNPQTIYVRLENVNNPDCFSITTFNLIVNEQPVLTMDDLWSICEGDSIIVEADTGYVQYLWSTGETTSSIVVTTAGDYWVTATNTYDTLVCETTKNITVTNSNIATITAIIAEDWSQNNNSIVVEVEGDGDYEYSIEGYNYQDSNVFTNLDVGDYTVYVNDKKGCGVANKDVYLMYYPNFFTPNGDTINDTWQIINSEKEPKNIIHIFDRYGKLLKQISPQSEGWDGTYNGQLMPTNDYWFVLYRENGKIYRGHFTLKR